MKRILENKHIKLVARYGSFPYILAVTITMWLLHKNALRVFFSWGIERYPHRYPATVVVLVMAALFLLITFFFWIKRILPSQYKILHIILTPVLTGLLVQVFCAMGTAVLSGFPITIFFLPLALFVVGASAFLIVPAVAFYYPVYRAERRRYLIILIVTGTGSGAVLAVLLSVLIWPPF